MLKIKLIAIVATMFCMVAPCFGGNVQYNTYTNARFTFMVVEDTKESKICVETNDHNFDTIINRLDVKVGRQE